jgi:import inner membrane translocase subunit TIM22
MRDWTGFGIGAFFSLMSSGMAFEDPFRGPQYEGLNNWAKSKLILKDMGKGLWRSGSGFAKVGALYAGSECVIEGVRTLSFHPDSVGD